MFLKEIETQSPDGIMKLAFAKMNASGQGIPEILHLFRFKKRSTDHLVRFTDEVMRGPSPLSPGLRELIGAFVSSRNQCRFCRCAHAPVAAKLLGQELVDEVLFDLESSRLDEAHKVLLRYVAKLAENPAGVDAADINRIKQAGWSEEAIYDALTVAAVFKFYNTWNNGSGVQTMSSVDYVHSGNRLLSMGYCMDFGLKATLKVLWVGRNEINFGDFKELMKIVLKKVAGAISGGCKDLVAMASAQTRPAAAGAASPKKPHAFAVAETGLYKEQKAGVSLVQSGDPAA